MSNRFEGDVHVAGTLSANAMSIPDAAVRNASIISGDPIDAEKVEQQYMITTPLSNHADDAATVRKVAHVAYVAGEIIQFKVGVTVAATSTGACVVDLKKNGSSILSSTVTINSGVAAFGMTTGTLSSSTYAAGDVLEVSINSVTGSTLPKGVFTRLIVREDAE